MEIGIARVAICWSLVTSRETSFFPELLGVLLCSLLCSELPILGLMPLSLVSCLREAPF